MHNTRCFTLLWLKFSSKTRYPKSLVSKNLKNLISEIQRFIEILDAMKIHSNITIYIQSSQPFSKKTQNLPTKVVEIFL